MSDKKVGVIGAGSFGTVVANLLAQNVKVKLYARSDEKIANMRVNRENAGYQLHENIEVCDNLQEVASECETLFPVVPSSGFRKMMRDLAPSSTLSHHDSWHQRVGCIFTKRHVY